MIEKKSWQTFPLSFASVFSLSLWMMFASKFAYFKINRTRPCHFTIIQSLHTPVLSRWPWFGLNCSEPSLNIVISLDLICFAHLWTFLAASLLLSPPFGSLLDPGVYRGGNNYGSLGILEPVTDDYPNGTAMGSLPNIQVGPNRPWTKWVWA